MMQSSRPLNGNQFGVYYLEIEQLQVLLKAVYNFVPLFWTAPKFTFCAILRGDEKNEKSENSEKVSLI